MTLEIRYAVFPDDLPQISRVYERSWKYAYRGIIPQEYLDSVAEGQWASGTDSPDRHTLVCAENGRIIGTSSFGGSRFLQYPKWGEVISLYLVPESMGKGYGRRLLETAVKELGKQGYSEVFLWVLEENKRARRFYERFGFSPAGDFMDTDIGGRTLQEVRYILSARGISASFSA